MATDKTPNYSTVQEALILEAIAAAGGTGNLDVAKALAADERMNSEDGARNYRSIIAKMSRMGVPYARQTAKSKDGSPVNKKADLVKRIAAKVSVDVAKLSGLENSPKLALETIVAAIAA